MNISFDNLYVFNDSDENLSQEIVDEGVDSIQLPSCDKLERNMSNNPLVVPREVKSNSVPTRLMKKIKSIRPVNAHNKIAKISKSFKTMHKSTKEAEVFESF